MGLGFTFLPILAQTLSVMAKYFLLLLMLTGLRSFGQDFKTQIADYRKGYMDDFLKDTHSPLKKDDLQFLRFFDADSTYRVTAQASVLVNAQAFIMPVFSGSGSEYVPYAVLKFALKDKPLE